MNIPKDAGEARVLVDLPTFGAVAGNLLVASKKEIKSLSDGGHVDPSPDAVDYAKSEKAKVVDATKKAAPSAEEKTEEPAK